MHFCQVILPWHTAVLPHWSGRKVSAWACTRQKKVWSRRISSDGNLEKADMRLSAFVLLANQECGRLRSAGWHHAADCLKRL